MRCFAFLALCCLVSVMGTGFSGNVDGQVVSFNEADQLMGQCGDYGPLATWVCYGGNCVSRG